MRKLSFPLLGLAVALALVALGRPAFAAPAFQTTEFTAELKGTEEVPDPGDADGTGMAMLTLDTANNTIAFTLNVENVTLPAAAAHIHEGASGVAGPVVVPLTAPDAAGTATGTATVDAALMQRIMANPADFYVNVHTSDFPGGAVRGQLAMVGGAAAPAAPAPAGDSAPATLPATGASSDPILPLAGLALLALLVGVGLRLSGPRRAGTR